MLTSQQRSEQDKHQDQPASLLYPSQSTYTELTPPPSFSTLYPDPRASIPEPGRRFVPPPRYQVEEKEAADEHDTMNDLNHLKLTQIVRTSTLFDPDPTVQSKKIIEEYNRGNKEDITEESIAFGKRIDVNQLRLVHRNNVPQLVPYTYYPRRLGVYMTGVTEEIGVYNQTDLCIGAHGRYLINVPQGKLVKAWEGNQPIFLGEGPHVIRHQNFRLDKSPIVELSENVFTHGNYSVIRVPRGKVAKIWIGSTPHILESRSEAYVFDDPTFKIVFQTIQDTKEYFTNASEQLIVHGSIKRILPRTGEVAIAYDNGKLVTFEATGKPVMIDSPTFIVDGFLKTNRQTLLFPSEETQEERRRKNPHDIDAITYETFRTSDGLPIGVNLLVAYEIENPQLTLEKLSKNEIKKHIENIVVAHMLSVIQSCSSSDFQKSGQNAVKEVDKSDPTHAFDIFQAPSAPSPFFKQLQDDTKQLADDLLKIGIKITQLRIEPPKILDKKIADEMAQNSLLNAKARAEVSVLDLNLQIKQQQATQAAEQERIKMEREKQNKIIQAQWEAEAIKIKAEAELEAAKMRAEAAKIEYEAKVRNIQMENDVQLRNMEAKARLFDQHPGLLNLEITRVQAQAMQGIQSIVSPDVVGSWYSTPGIGLFSGNRAPQLLQRPDQKTEQRPEPRSDPRSQQPIQPSTVTLSKSGVM